MITIDIVNSKEVLDLEVQKRGRITIPSRIRDKYHIDEGVMLKIAITEINYGEDADNPADIMYEQVMDKLQEKLQRFEEQEKEVRDDENKAYRKAYERLKEEYLTDE